MEPLVFHRTRTTGWIEVVCGSMFSGKTEELIRRLKRARIARQRVEIYKPSTDTRYSEDEVVSHDETAIASTPVHTASQILLLVSDADVVGIDEGQFFDDELVNVCQQLARQGKRVIVAGLDQDYLGKPFDPMPKLMAVAEYVTKLHAVCVVCGTPANHSQRITANDEHVLLGARESYEPRCRQCFSPTPQPPAGDSRAVHEVRPANSPAEEPF
jgi:thymidine kinase